MAYTKTNWTEATPITAQNLNKLEQGVANALDTTTGGTVSGDIILPNNIGVASKDTGGNNHWIGYVNSNNQMILGSASIPTILRSNVNPSVLVGSNTYTLYHTGNKPTASTVGALSTSGGTLGGNLTIDKTGTTWGALTVKNTIAGANYHYTFGADQSDGAGALSIVGQNTSTGKKAILSLLPDSGVFRYNGGCIGAYMFDTDNNGGYAGRMTNGTRTWIGYVDTSDNVCLGYSTTNTTIQSKANPTVKVGSSSYTMYHSGNKPTYGWLNYEGNTSNMDTQTGIGVFSWGTDATGRPASYGSMLQWGNGESMSPGSNQNWVTQLASSTDNLLYYRTRTNSGAWNSWGQIYTSRNPQPSATQWNGKTMRVGSYSSGASGYITFSTS